MLTKSEATRVNELIDRYQDDPRSVTKSEILELGNSIRPNSPKTGKPITFGSYANYIYKDLPSHLTKDELLKTLVYIIVDDTQISKLGFFA